MKDGENKISVERNQLCCLQRPVRTAGLLISSVCYCLSQLPHDTTWHDTSSLPPNAPVWCPTLLPRGTGRWRVLILS